MILVTEAIVTNERNETLLILRDDVRTWCQPGGALEAGELPDEAVAREVEEETGVQVHPVRLVGLTFTPRRRGDELVLTFRCIQRGGELSSSPEALRVAFLPAASLPTPMLAMHRQRLEKGLRHAGGPPDWDVYRYPWYLRLARPLLDQYLNLRNRLTGRNYEPPPGWESAAFVVIRDDAGRVLWVKRRDHAVWNLPGGGAQPGEAPWTAALRETREETGLDVRLDGLTGIYVKPENRIVFVFTARMARGALAPNEEAQAFGYFAPGEEPPNSLPKHVARVADAVGPDEITLFRRQDEPATDLAVLARSGNDSC
jgi:8-oxo-dGTP diphosphatase